MQALYMLRSGAKRNTNGYAATPTPRSSPKLPEDEKRARLVVQNEQSDDEEDDIPFGDFVEYKNPDMQASPSLQNEDSLAPSASLAPPLLNMFENHREQMLKQMASSVISQQRTPQHTTLIERRSSDGALYTFNNGITARRASEGGTPLAPSNSMANLAEAFGQFSVGTDGKVPGEGTGATYKFQPGD